MNARFPFVMLITVTVLSLGFMLGCSQNGQTGGDQDAIRSDSDHQHAEGVDPHDVPLTDEQKQQLREDTANFTDAVARIKKFRDTIQEETKDGLPANPLKAHQALDQADLLVQWLPKIAQDSDISKEHWETINTAANELRELLDKVHESVDNKVDPDFGSVEQQMETKIAELEAIAE